MRSKKILISVMMLVKRKRVRLTSIVKRRKDVKVKYINQLVNTSKIEPTQKYNPIQSKLKRMYLIYILILVACTMLTVYNL